MSITDVVRSAYILYRTRGEMFDAVSREVGVDRHTAKKLCFAFLWFASEEQLQKIKEDPEFQFKGN